MDASTIKPNIEYVSQDVSAFRFDFLVVFVGQKA